MIQASLQAAWPLRRGRETGQSSPGDWPELDGQSHKLRPGDRPEVDGQSHKLRPGDRPELDEQSSKLRPVSDRAGGGGYGNPPYKMACTVGAGCWLRWLRRSRIGT